MGPIVVFAMLAEREVKFYIECARVIQSRHPAAQIHFINFFEPAFGEIERAGFIAHNFYGELDRTGLTETPKAVATSFGIENPEDLLRHEAVTFDLRDEKKLLEKFARYLIAADALFKRILNGRDPQDAVVFQELGGFISILSVYLAAKHRKIRHVFFEPAFFRGRVIPVVDTLSTVRPKDASATKVSAEALAYIEKALAQKTVVIPGKDKHHFRDMNVGKLVNASNARKIAKKLFDKYILRKRFEFNHIGQYSFRFVRMLVNRQLRRRLYTEHLSTVKKPFVYFPLHVELDYSLTIRSPQYFDQLGILRSIAEALPEGVSLIAKEHPASIGGFSQERLEALRTNFKNFHIMHPQINSYELLEEAACIVTINSKVGAEALAAKKKVFALGDAFYSDCDMIEFADSVDDLKTRVVRFLQSSEVPNFANFDRFFSQVWEQSFAGELYDVSDNNVEKFVEGISRFIKRAAGETYA